MNRIVIFRQFVLVLLCCLFMGEGLQGQAGRMMNLRIEEFSGTTGPPAGIVNSVSRTENGLMAICTNQGLYVYDGYSFRHYLEDYPGLRDICYRACEWAFFRDGKVYMVFSTGIKIVDLKTGTVQWKTDLTESTRIVFAGIFNNTLYTVHLAGEIRASSLVDLSAVKRYSISRISDGYRINDRSFLIHTFEGELYRLHVGDSLELISKEVQKPKHLKLHFNVKGDIIGASNEEKLVWGDTIQSLEFPFRSFVSQKYPSWEQLKCDQFFQFQPNFLCVVVNKTAFFIEGSKESSSLYLETESFRALYRLRNRQILASCYSGMMHLDSSGKLLQRLPDISLSHSMFQDRFQSGQVYALTTRDGICAFNEATGKFEKGLYGTKGLHLNGQYAETDSTRIVFGMAFFRFDEKHHTVRKIEITGLKREGIWDLVSLKGNRYLAAVANGIAVVDFGKHSIQMVYKGSCRWLIRPSGENKVLAGIIGKGIYTIDLHTLEVEEFTRHELNKLAFIFPYSGIYRKSSNELFLGTGSGLYRVSLATGFTQKMVTMLGEYNSSSLLLLDENHLLAGGVHGIELIKFGHIPTQEKYPIVPIISEWRRHKVNGELKIAFDIGKRSLIIEPSDLETELVICTPMDFLKQEFVWRYRITGIHKQWIVKHSQPGQRAIISLSNLDAGNYRLELQVRKPETDWGAMQTWDLKVVPKWYNTWWVQLLVIILCIFIIVLLVNGYYRQRSRKGLEKLQYMTLQNELVQSELRTLRNQLNPHMFANSMQTIQYFILSKSKVEAAEYVAKYSHLMRKNLDNGAHDFVSLHEEIEFIQEYCSLESMRRSEKLNFSLVVDPSIDPQTISIPSMIIQPFVENAFKHGKAPENSDELHVGIHFYCRDNRELVCTIENSIEFAQATHVNRLVSGIEISKSRLQLYNNFMHQNGRTSFSITGNTFTCEIVIPFKHTVSELTT